MPDYRKLFTWAGVLVFLVLLIYYASACVQAGREGLILCAQRVIPSLFPFFVISRLVISSGLTRPLGALCRPLMRRAFHLRGELAAPLLLGLTGGYPIGAAAIADLVRQGQCSREEGCRLLAFTSNTGPAFAVGMCGVTLFGSTKIGCLLYLIHALSAILTGFLLNRSYPMPEKRTAPPQPREQGGEIVTAIRDSFSACLSITAFVTFFSVLVRLLKETGILAVCSRLLGCMPFLSQENAAALLWGLLEIAGGLSAVQAQSVWAFPLCSLLLAFGGISVLFQTANVLSGSGLPLRPYILGKCLQAVLAFLLTFICFSMF